MPTLEQLKWMPIYLVMFSLLFLTGTYFYKQSLLTYVGDEYLREAANNGMFTSEDIESLLNRVDKLGFDKSKVQIQISPAEALNIGVCKSSNQFMKLTINPNTTAYLSTIFAWIIPDSQPIRYYYQREAKSEEFFD